MRGRSHADDLCQRLDACAAQATRAGTNFSNALQEAKYLILELQADRVEALAGVSPDGDRPRNVEAPAEPPAPGSRSDPAYAQRLVHRLRELSRWGGARQMGIDDLLREASERIASLTPPAPEPVPVRRPPQGSAVEREEPRENGARALPRPVLVSLPQDSRQAHPQAEPLIQATVGPLGRASIEGRSLRSASPPAPQEPALPPAPGGSGRGRPVMERFQPADPILLPPALEASEPPSASERPTLPSAAPLTALLSAALADQEPARQQALPATAAPMPAVSDETPGPPPAPRAPDHRKSEPPPRPPLEPTGPYGGGILSEHDPLNTAAPAGTDRSTALALPGGGRIGAAIRIHSPSGKRVHPRFNVPFTVQIAGARYSGVNLSLGGIGLAGPSLSAPEGEIFKAAISFSFPTHEVTVPAHLAAVRWDASDRAIAFQFLDLNMDTARVFQTITDKWASGDLLTLDPVIAAPGASTALALPGPVVRGLRGIGLAVRYGAVVTGAGVMIALLGGVLYERWFSIVPEQAAVASDATPVLAPTSGHYQERTPVGSPLKIDDEIGRLVPINPSPLRTEWQLRLAHLKIRLEGQKAARGRAQAAQESVTRILAAERDRARVEQHLLSNQIAGQRKRVEAVNADLKRGKVTSAQAAAEAARLAHLEHLLVQSESSEALVNERLNSAELGFSGAAGRAGERPPAEVERDIGQTSGEIAALERALSEGSDSTPVRSSCECILHAAPRNGEYVERGAPLAHLTPSPAQTGSGLWQVDALVRPDQVQAIALGDPVELRLGPSLEPIPGRVAAISLDPASRPRLGLPASLVADGRFVRVSIEVEGKQPAPALGTPVRVRFQPVLRTGIALVDGIAARLEPKPASGSAPGTPDR